MYATHLTPATLDSPLEGVSSKIDSILSAKLKHLRPLVIIDGSTAGSDFVVLIFDLSVSSLTSFVRLVGFFSCPKVAANVVIATNTMVALRK